MTYLCIRHGILPQKPEEDHMMRFPIDFYVDIMHFYDFIDLSIQFLTAAFGIIIKIYMQ